MLVFCVEVLRKLLMLVYELFGGDFKSLCLAVLALKRVEERVKFEKYFLLSKICLESCILKCSRDFVFLDNK